jgi:outer membrane protein
MKKTLLALSCSAALFAGTVQADTLGFEVGATLWQADISGKNLDNSFDKGDNVSFYGSFEHPVPIIPNIKVSINQLENEAKDSTTDDDIDASFNDFLLYYEVLDNIVELDLGFGARMYDGESGSEKLDPTLGTVYAKVQFNLPVTGLSLGVDTLVGMDSGDNKATDATAYVRWESGLGLGVAGGYRMMQTTFEFSDGSANDADFDGAYVSAFYHF